LCVFCVLFGKLSRLGMLFVTKRGVAAESVHNTRLPVPLEAAGSDLIQQGRDNEKDSSPTCRPPRGQRRVMAAADLLMPLLKLLAVALYLLVPVGAER
jgi:hypothetical protein